MKILIYVGFFLGSHLSAEDILPGRLPRIYVVEAGDTLFDICEQLLGRGQDWPKLWALNPYIKNPHFLWPGMRLSFYPGDEDIPPYLRISIKSQPPSDSLSSSPLSKSFFTDASTDSFNYDRFSWLTPEASLVIPGFPLDSPKILGHVENAGERWLRDGDFFVLSKDISEPMVTFVRPRETLYGKVYTFLGHGYVESLKPKKTRIKIFESFIPIEEGDCLIPYERTVFSLDSSQEIGFPRVGTDRILAADEYREILHEGSWVYIWSDSDDSFMPNKNYIILQDLGKGEEVQATVKIIKNQGKSAIGYITESSRELILSLGKLSLMEEQGL